jgi:hypothetical protein
MSDTKPPSITHIENKLWVVTEKINVRLLAVLATTKILLSRSQHEGFGLEGPDEAGEQIDQIIDALFLEQKASS